MSTPSKRILVLGASGMLGNAVLRLFSRSPGYKTVGTVRALAPRPIPGAESAKLLGDVDVERTDSLIAAVAAAKPDAIVNCVGVVKQLAAADDPLTAIPINALLPHRLARLAELTGARFIQISTDCVFSGQKGGYVEGDPPDANDLYGRSKLLGEVNYPHAVTLRTSIIGHELGGARSLVNWFLSQEGSTKGYRQAIFSGLPPVELARLIRDFVLPDLALSGLYHVSAAPIDKYSLLKLVAEVYGKDIEIEPDDRVKIDRSLNSDRFRAATGYVPPDWATLVRAMHASRV